MCKLQERQIKVLALHFKGKRKTDIQRMTGFASSTVDYALKSGLRNIKEAITTTKIAVNRGFLTVDQVRQLKLLLDRLPNSRQGT